ncbi:MAG: Pr6Pr family membrane protein, partial [Chitinophagales bacterium]
MRRVLLMFGAMMGWVALILQLYLSIVNRTTSLPESLIRYFTYFTILTNILVALSFTIQWLAPDSRSGRFFSLPQTATAVTVYIVVVGV